MPKKKKKRDLFDRPNRRVILSLANVWGIGQTFRKGTVHYKMGLR